MSKKFTELVIGEAGVPDNIAHRDGVHRIVSGDGQHPRAISHDNVFSLPGDPERSLFERSNSVKMIHAWEFGHG
jgi:hypothetical protein